MKKNGFSFVIATSFTLFVLTLASPVFAQLPADVSRIDDDPRCASALDGVTNAEAALRTGCARFWPVWPEPVASGEDRRRQEELIRHLQAIWYAAQLSGRGHYAARAPSDTPTPASIVKTGTQAAGATWRLNIS